MKKILCTGGAGFIGSNLVRKLVFLGHEVTVLDDMSRGKAERLAGIPHRITQGDIRDLETVTMAMQGQDSVIHLAYLQGTARFYSEPRQVLDVAVRGMLNVLSACETTGCGDLMLLSSSEAYQVASIVPTPETIPLTVPDVLNARYSYGGGKIACEIMSLAWARTGVLDRAIIVRPHNIYSGDMGNEHVIPDFCHRMNGLVREHPTGIIPFPIQGTGLETRSFCHVSDCIDQMIFLLEKAEGLGVWNIGNMDERTITEVAHAIAACYGREIKVIPGTLPKGSPPRRLPDLAKITTLGYRGPVVDFAKGIEEAVAWYQVH